MIEKVELQEHGPFREATTSLARLTVFVGPNASGKTTLLDAIENVLDPNDDSNAYLAKMCRRGATGEPRISLALSTGERYSCPGPESSTNLPAVRRLNLTLSSLREPSRLMNGSPDMDPSGRGLPSALAYLQANLVDDDKLVQDLVGSIVPSFVRATTCRVELKDGGGSAFGESLLFDMKSANALPVEMVSDGTLLVLGLLVSVFSSSRNRNVVYIVEDLERGLHPRTFDKYIECLRRLTEEMGIQIIATTHTPYLLDWLKPAEIRVTGFLEDGTATIRRLTDHPEFEKWDGYLTPGEFWATVGEDWIGRAL